MAQFAKHGTYSEDGCCLQHNLAHVIRTLSGLFGLGLVGRYSCESKAAESLQRRNPPSIKKKKKEEKEEEEEEEEEEKVEEEEKDNDNNDDDEDNVD
ncbi:hypothetical protein PoB_001474000 [Plakobranchus ocellatus]|uniref:Uncharacterized protein n=1 Tax=Plakobranchus ocellatus TaxID=259542 RepID=A0AAV3YYH0_9GAST|nr:hypothetical protein PoB_001474000 [Plakobranchus ocellatus]